MRPHRSSRVDANHAVLRGLFINSGLGVCDVSQSPCGVDLFVSFAGVTVAVEIKDGSKPVSARKLTDVEVRFKDQWKGHYRIVETEEQALNLIKELKRGSMG